MATNDIDLKISVTSTADTSALDAAQRKIDDFNASGNGTGTGNWAQIVQERERATRSLQAGYDDLIDTIDEEADAIRETGKAGREAGDQISQGLDKADSKLGALKSKWTQLIGGVGLVTGAWTLGRRIGDWISEQLDSATVAAERKARAKQAELSAKLRQEAEFARSATAAVNDEQIRNRYDEERAAIQQINDLYRQRAELVDRMAAGRTADLAAQRQILDAETKLEASKIRQQVATGQLTDSQGRKALIALEAQSAEERRRLEAEADAEGIEAARQKLSLAKQQNELYQSQLEASGGDHLLFSGASLLEYYSRAQAAIKGSGTRMQWEASWQSAQEAINSGDAGQMRAGRQTQAQLRAQEQDARTALAIVERIEAAARDAGIAPENEDDPILFIHNLAARLDEARDNNRELKEQVRQSGEAVKAAAVALQDASAGKSRADLVRSAESAADAATRNEQEITARNADRTEIQKKIDDWLSNYIATVLERMSQVRNNVDARYPAAGAFRETTTGGRVLSQFQTVARLGSRAGDRDLARLRDANSDLQQSNYLPEIKDEIDKLVNDLLKAIRQAQRKTAELDKAAAADSRRVTRGTAAGAIERNTVGQMVGAMRDGRIDEQLEKPALQAALAQMKANGSASQSSRQIIQLLEQMLRSSESSLAENAAFKSQLAALQKRFDQLATQVSRPRNTGR